MGASTDLLLSQNKVTGSGLPATDYMEVINLLNQKITNFSDSQGLMLGAESRTNKGVDDGFNLDGQNYAGGNNQVAIGYQAVCYGWRGTAIGTRSIAGTTSATAIGCGVIARGVHHVAVGRGAETSTEVNAGVVIGSIGMNDLYMGMNWGHRYNELPESGISQGDVLVPSSKETRFMGIDAFDARDVLYNSGTTYGRGKRVTDGTNSYMSLIDGNLGNALPSGSGSNAQWRWLSTCNKGARSDYNVDGGHGALCAGRGTGSAKGGEVRFYNAPAVGGNGQNSKLPFLKAGFFDSEPINNDQTYFNLYIKGQGEKRVIVDNNGFLKVL